MKPASLFICLSMFFLATTGCRGYAFVETPTTDGFHSKLPSPYTRAVVWGGRPDTVQSASTWLLKKGILVVDQTKVLQAAADQKVSLSGYQYVETDVLRMAKLVGARLVVFSNAEIGSWDALDWSGGFPRSQRVYSATISLRAVDVNTGEIEWSGKAQSTERFGNIEEGVSLLTCHALATWIRPHDERSQFTQASNAAIYIQQPKLKYLNELLTAPHFPLHHNPNAWPYSYSWKTCRIAHTLRQAQNRSFIDFLDPRVIL